MRMRGIAVMAAVGLFALPALAGAAPQLTATGVRIGDHPGYVRVVVDFNGNVPEREVELAGHSGTMFAVRLNHPGAISQTSGRTGEGVKVALQSGTQALHITMSFAPNRLKYLLYAVVTGNRLAIDLWKSAPPSARTQTCDGLSLTGRHVEPGVVTASGTQHGIFENQFQVVVRGAHGKVLGQKHVTDSGTWSATVNYTAAHGQAGTLEAVAFSAKDGALECLAQRRVWLPRTS